MITQSARQRRVSQAQTDLVKRDALDTEGLGVYLWIKVNGACSMVRHRGQTGTRITEYLDGSPHTLLLPFLSSLYGTLKWESTNPDPTNAQYDPWAAPNPPTPWPASYKDVISLGTATFCAQYFSEVSISLLSRREYSFSACHYPLSSASK